MHTDSVIVPDVANTDKAYATLRAQFAMRRHSLTYPGDSAVTYRAERWGLVAFNAGNVEAVALALRAKYPEAQLIVAADDDYQTEGNPGLSKAIRP